MLPVGCKVSINEESKLDKNGKAIRKLQIIEVQTNGHDSVKQEFEPSEVDECLEMSNNLNEQFGYGGIEYFVKTLRFA